MITLANYSHSVQLSTKLAGLSLQSVQKDSSTGQSGAPKVNLKIPMEIPAGYILRSPPEGRVYSTKHSAGNVGYLRNPQYLNVSF